MLKRLFVIIAGCVLLAPCLPAQTVDAPGVTVDLGGAVVMHRGIVLYPAAVAAQGIQGTVNVQVTLDARGNVADALVLSGPLELRRTVLDSVLQWHFARGGAATRQVSVAFVPPAGGGAAAVRATGGNAGPASVSGGVLGGVSSQTIISSGQLGAAVAVPGVAEPRKLARITVSGFNEQLRGELLAALPAREGDMITRGDSLTAIAAAAKQYDEHLSVSIGWNSSGEATLQISAPGLLAGPTVSASAPPADWQGIRVGGNVQMANIVNKVAPEYPAIARQARIQDHVILDARIGPDGTMQDLRVVSGHPLLRQAALDAAKQWTFKPTLLNGQPVGVITQLDVNFVLP
jgi:TonB family protein